jgi:flavin reductase (DIM6/NTAB) family NADH-FMN oxidoreductase RutF
MPEATSQVARALGRIPSGLFIVTTRDGDRPVGFLGSFVMQMGFEPPTVCVAVGKERGPLPAMRAHGHFALSILDGQSRGLMTPFLKRPPPGKTPFDGLALRHSASGCPVLKEALAWLDCRIRSEHETGDHVVVFGEVVEAELLRDGEPHVHVRKNGLGY